MISPLCPYAIPNNLEHKFLYIWGHFWTDGQKVQKPLLSCKTICYHLPDSNNQAIEASRKAIFLEDLIKARSFWPSASNSLLVTRYCTLNGFSFFDQFQPAAPARNADANGLVTEATTTTSAAASEPPAGSTPGAASGPRASLGLTGRPSDAGRRRKSVLMDTSVKNFQKMINSAGEFMKDEIEKLPLRKYE